eukprot:scaffold122659_cov30-Phaeocystis_antarctica.AAC.1
MARKTIRKRYLGRRRSSRSEELTTNGASPRRGVECRAPKMGLPWAALGRGPQAECWLLRREPKPPA